MSDKVVDQLYALYKEEGLSLGEVAKKHGSSRQNIQQRFERHGLKRRSRIVAPETVRLMYRDYTAGLSLTQVGRIYGRSGCTVGQIFVARRLRLRSRKVPMKLVRAMHKDYESGLTLHQVGLRYGRFVWIIFKRHNLKMRPGYGGHRRRTKKATGG